MKSKSLFQTLTPGVQTLIYKGQLLTPFQLLQFDRYCAGHKGVFHRDQGCQIMLVRKTEFCFEFRDGDRMVLKPGCAGVIPHGVEHSWRSDDRCPCLTLLLYLNPLRVEDVGDLALVFGGGLAKPFSVDIGLEKTGRLFDQLEEECCRLRPASAAWVHSQLMGFLSWIGRDIMEKNRIHEETREGRIVRLALNFMENHYRESVTLSQLARQSSLGTSRFSEIFHNQIGRSPVQHLNELRLKKAEALLRHSTLSVGEIAAYLGYRTENYFYRFFKKHKGRTPLSLRRAGDGNFSRKS
ncbi:MAG: helix-turn-helix domain-containing protein [Verrucomicrobiae bacterium]|nr:helix-turn-helix domain-containing protein [Verrucomicrobiae bacterium]